MNKALVACLSVLVLLRSIILLRRKEYRLFPLLFLVFAIGGMHLSNGIRRFLSDDNSLRPKGRFGGQAWYQDVGAGLLIATIAIIGCGSYIEQKDKTAREKPSP
jgi:hypothetical protein